MTIFLVMLEILPHSSLFIYRLNQSPLVDESRPEYADLLHQNLGLAPWKVSETHSKIYFRTAEENLMNDLKLLKDQGWFGPTTTKVQVSLKVFNGLTATWGILRYKFEQSSSERIYCMWIAGFGL